MTSLQQQKKEAREEFRNRLGDMAVVGDYIWLDSLIARTREQTLLEVEAGMPKEKKENIDGYLSRYWNKGSNDFRAAMLAHLRTLREGITGNEHAK